MITAVRLLVTFLVKRQALYDLTKVPRRFRFRSSSFFYFILLLFAFFSLGLFLFVIGNSRPSYYCGPLAFNKLIPIDDPNIDRVHTDIVDFYFEANTTEFSSNSNKNTLKQKTTLRKIFSILKSKTFLFLCTVLICIFTYFYKQQNQAHANLMSRLNQELNEEKDQRKQYLNELKEVRDELEVVKNKYRKEKRLRTQSISVNPGGEMKEEVIQVPTVKADQKSK